MSKIHKIILDIFLLFFIYLSYISLLYFLSYNLKSHSINNSVIYIVLSIDYPKLLVYMVFSFLLETTIFLTILFFDKDDYIYNHIFKKVFPFSTVLFIVLACILSLNEQQYNFIVTTLSFISIFTFLLKRDTNSD